MGDGYARHTPTLNGERVARTIICDSSLLPHVGELLSHLFRDYEWQEVGSTIDAVLDETEITLESWYTPVMIGTIATFLGALPDFWLPLAGGTFNEADYPELYQALDAQYQNPGAGTFVLPDFSDVFIVGALGSHALGSTGGESTHVLTEGELPSHTHTYTMPVTGATIGGAGPPLPVVNAVTPGTPTSATGAGNAHENKPPYIAVTFGIFSGR